MLVVRIVGLLVAIALGVCVLLWVVTGERRWLLYGWTLFKVALVFVAIFLVFLFGERLLVL